MKHATTLKTFNPFTAEQMAKAIANAPDTAACDEELLEANQNDWTDAIVSRSLPELREKLAQRKAGRPKSDAPKQSATIRYSPEVLAAFKATGKGWQTRMNEALKDWLKTHPMPKH